MTQTAQANEALEARRAQALARMDRNDELVRDVRAGRIAEVIADADVGERVSVSDFFSRENEQE